jgi:hypothetical protein
LRDEGSTGDLFSFPWAAVTIRRARSRRNDGGFVTTAAQCLLESIHGPIALAAKVGQS